MKIAVSLYGFLTRITRFDLRVAGDEAAVEPPLAVVAPI